EADCVARLEQLAKRRPNGWLLAQGWREYRWNPPVLPSKHSLDAAYPNRPVALYSGDAHTLWLNTKALEELGVTNNSVAPEGGSYDRDENGELLHRPRSVAMELMPCIVASFIFDEIAHAYEGFLKVLPKTASRTATSADGNQD
ncbi:MAG: amidohydrolase family protein, partial [Eggerthellaceae bacterium]